eukprot:COSAG01_NODE_7286_length_3269_cov_0.980126_5_plen_181_part_00
MAAGPPRCGGRSGALFAPLALSSGLDSALDCNNTPACCCHHRCRACGSGSDGWCTGLPRRGGRGHWGPPRRHHVDQKGAVREPVGQHLGGLWCEHAGYDALGGLASPNHWLPTAVARPAHHTHGLPLRVRRSALSSGAMIMAVLPVWAATSKSVAEVAGAPEAGAPTLDAAGRPTAVRWH